MYGALHGTSQPKGYLLTSIKGAELSCGVVQCSTGLKAGFRDVASVSWRCLYLITSERLKHSCFGIEEAFERNGPGRCTIVR